MVILSIGKRSPIWGRAQQYTRYRLRESNKYEARNSKWFRINNQIITKKDEEKAYIVMKKVPYDVKNKKVAKKVL